MFWVEVLMIRITHENNCVWYHLVWALLMRASQLSSECSQKKEDKISKINVQFSIKVKLVQ